MYSRRPISISEQIFEQLEKDILSGRYAVGETLSEQKLSDALGVSRTPIREALSRLQQEHLIEDSSKGLVVVGITKEDVMDMYDIRVKLEGMAAAKAALKISDEEIKELGEALEMQAFYMDKQNVSGEDRSDKIKDMDSRFHEIIYSACGSGALRDVLVSLHKKINKYRKASVSRTGRASESVREHKEIYEAILKRDPDRANMLMTQHVINAKKSIDIMEVE